MKSVKHVLMMMMALSLAFTSCQEEVETLGRNDKAVAQKVARTLATKPLRPVS